MLKHYVFEPSKTRKVAVLIPQKDLHPKYLERYYAEPLKQTIHRSQFIFIGLPSPIKGEKKFTAYQLKQHLKNAEKIVSTLKVSRVLVCSADHFKILAGVSKADPHYGYSRSGSWKDVTFFASINYVQIFLNPNVEYKLRLSIQALEKDLNNHSGVFSRQVLRNPMYLTDPSVIQQELAKRSGDLLACDVETRGLKPFSGVLKSIAFAWNEHEGLAFEITDATKPVLKQAFLDRKAPLIFHNASFDTKMIIRDLFMSSWTDLQGLVEGIRAMYLNHMPVDTKLLAYMCLNSTADNSLGLKNLAYVHTGDYAMEDLHDVDSIPLQDLLTYNLTDAVATFYVYNQFHQEVSSQYSLINRVLHECLPTVTQSELIGLPFSNIAVQNLKQKLNQLEQDLLDNIQQIPQVFEYNKILREQAASKANETLKTYCKLPSAFEDMVFNPGSSKQVAQLLHEILELPVLERTPKRHPSVGAKVLKKLRNLVKDPDHAALLDNLISWSDVSKISNTFIPAFENSQVEHSGKCWLQGNFNVGGTKSGRMSSNSPNLQQIPSTGTQYAKPIKQCFQAPNGWIMVGADYNALEDRIVTIQTQDPNRLKVYQENYDGHCLRAFSYFENEMSDIDMADPDSINSIAQKYPKHRQNSKGPSFAMQYGGTEATLIRNFGFSREEAIKIKAGYDKLYQVSVAWSRNHIAQAQKQGYMELAYGLRLRTPVLAQSVQGGKKSYRAIKEGKTAINARTQSYGLVNSRAANDFMQLVWQSPYSTDVLPLAQIHDSQYYLVRAKLNLLHWVNENLIRCMCNPNLIDIEQPAGDELWLTAEMEIYLGDWSHDLIIPNNIPKQDLKDLIYEATKAAA